MSNYPAIIKQAIDRGQLTQVTRRAEIYESDGITPWLGGAADRLIDGGVNLTYGDNERRTVDVTLRNNDNVLRASPNGFWYDKVLKIYRGVKYSPNVVFPKTAVIESVNGLAGSGAIVSRLAQIGLPDAKFIGSPTVASLADYDVVVSYTGTSATAYSSLLMELYAQGKNIITVASGNTATQVPHLTGGTAQTAAWGISQLSPTGSLSAGWGTEASSTAAGTAFSGVTVGAVALARYTVGTSTNSITASIGLNGNGGKWFDLHLPVLLSTNTTRLMANVVDFFKEEYGSWETQVGEFVIDRIDGANFPTAVKITGRDYVKKCMLSKVENAVTFAAGTSVGVIVAALAGNAGITKFRLATMPEVLNSEMSFDRGTPRWDIMGAAARSQGYELYFDNEGYLVTRKYLDPTISPENYVFQTGANGNLSSIDRSVNDSRIYNHIVVYGDPPSGEARMPFVGEAKNTNQASPTRIAKLGDRYYAYASTFFSTQTQCQDYATRLLGLHSLESFELSFGAINYPWLEAGEIGKVIDPNAVASDPTKYLIDSGTIPLGLGPMSFTGKRVVIV